MNAFEILKTNIFIFLRDWNICLQIKMVYNQRKNIVINSYVKGRLISRQLKTLTHHSLRFSFKQSRLLIAFIAILVY